VKATEGYFLLRENGRVESFQPHMHLRGKAMTMEAILPNGQTQVISHVADFNFNWHNTYVYKETASPLLPKGTIIKVTAWHDNTVANKANPDPNVWWATATARGRDGTPVNDPRTMLTIAPRPRAPQGRIHRRCRSKNPPMHNGRCDHGHCHGHGRSYYRCGRNAAGRAGRARANAGGPIPT
jgi:hypothetical protein